MLPQACVCFLEIERLGIVGAGPLPQMKMVGVSRILDGQQEISVPARATAVLRRTGACASRADQEILVGARVPDLLDFDRVVPPVPEVVLVRKGISLGHDLLEVEAAFVSVVGKVEINARGPVAPTVDKELVEMAVRPTERILDYVMEPKQRDMTRNENSTPDRRVDVSQGDLELEDL